MSFRKTIEVEIDEYILQQIIERCYGLEHTIRVSNNRGNWIELTSHNLRWCTVTGETKQKTVKLIQAKEIFISRIHLTEKFQYNDDLYYKEKDTWYKSNIL